MRCFSSASEYTGGVPGMAPTAVAGLGDAIDGDATGCGEFAKKVGERI